MWGGSFRVFVDFTVSSSCLAESKKMGAASVVQRFVIAVEIAKFFLDELPGGRHKYLA
jgi:hypothetical protein